MSDVYNVPRASGRQGQTEPVITNPFNYWKVRTKEDSTWLDRMLYPSHAEDQALGRQMVMSDYEQTEALKNRYNTLKDLGVNPNTIAAGISGAPTSSAIQPISQQPNPLEVASNAAGALAGGVNSLADAAFKSATLQPTIEKLNSESGLNLEKIGLTREETIALQTDNFYRKDNWEAELRLKNLNAKNLQGEFEIMRRQHDILIAQYDKELAQIDLLRAQEGETEANRLYLEKLKEKTDYESQFAQLRIDTAKKHGFDILNSSVDAIIAQRAMAGLDNDGLTDELSSYYRKKQKAEAEEQASASWFARPNSVAEAVSSALDGLSQMLTGKGLHGLMKDSNQLLSNPDAKELLTQAYNDAKNDLYSLWKEKRTHYNKLYMYGIAKSPQELQEAEKAMNDAKKAYDEFTFEEFVKQIK